MRKRKKIEITISIRERTYRSLNRLKERGHNVDMSSIFEDGAFRFLNMMERMAPPTCPFCGDRNVVRPSPNAKPLCRKCLEKKKKKNYP